MKFSKIVILIFLSLALLILMIISLLDFYRIYLTDEDFVQLKKCPYCFGTTICNDLKSQKIQLPYNLVNNNYLFDDLFNIKNVFFALNATNGEKIVVKKLAHNNELNNFDQNEFNSSKAKTSILDFLMKNLEQKQLKASSIRLFLPTNDFVQCLSDRVVHLLYKFVHANKGAILSENTNLMTILMVNPEPLVLQLFPETDGWPFPRYYGSCGRLIFESFNGLTLDKYIYKPFIERAKIALSLLKSIDTLYNNEIDLAVYLTDIGYENIAFDELKQKVYFIDVENVVIVDRQKIKKDLPITWNSSVYVSKFDECGKWGDCASFNTDSLCKAYYADFNYYTVCRNILSSYASDSRIDRNFLHSIPIDIDAEYRLNYLLNLCAKNDGSFKNGRFEVAFAIRTALEHTLKSNLKTP